MKNNLALTIFTIALLISFLRRAVNGFMNVRTLTYDALYVLKPFN